MLRKPHYVSLVVSAALIVRAGTSVHAHHAFAAEYDADKPVQLHGSVNKVEWVNPHAWIHIEVKDVDGKVVEWSIETGAPNALIRRGFKRDSIPIGVEVTVNGYQAKNGSNKVNGRDVTLSNGTSLFVGSSGTGAPSDSDGKKK